MHPARTISRLACILAGLAAAFAGMPAVLASTSPRRARPLSWADPPLPPGWSKPPPLLGHVHAVVTGGMPGWQITLITAGAVLAAAVVALLARAARRRATTSAA